VIPARLSRTLHKWLALVVGAQALLWIVSGLYMVAVDLDFIHGDTLVRNLTTPPPRTGSWLPLNALRTRIAGIEQLRIKGLPGFDQPLYEVKAAGRTLLIDGMTGQILSPLDESQISALARQYYAGRGSPATIELLVGEPPLEIQSRQLPLWRVQFDDWHESTLYIHPDNGELVTRRHRLWRWFDALWMLHIMDYEARTNVNNALLRAATVAGLALAASGLWLLYFSFRRRRTQLANRD
jgi:uncharacterized iron-regulated membrane protein